MTNVGRLNYTKTGSKNLDFYLANHRLCFIFVTKDVVKIKIYWLMCISKLTVCFMHVLFVIRGQSIRVTLWGGLTDVLVEKKATHVGMCAVVVTCVSAKHYNSKCFWTMHPSHVQDNSLNSLTFNITCQTSSIYPAVHPPNS